MKPILRAFLRDHLFFVSSFVSALVAVASLTAMLAACTPAARQQAGAVVSTLGPVLCSTLAAVTGSNGAREQRQARADLIAHEAP